MPYLTVPKEAPVTEMTPIQLYVEDTGGDGRPIVLIHGWPLSAQAWAEQIPALVDAGHRVVAYDRRGFGRSDKSPFGYDYDTFAADLAEVMTQLDLRDAVLVGFSMGGGEVARYLGAHGSDRVAGAVLAAAVTPALCITADNPDGGMPLEGFAELREQCRGDRDGFLRTFMTNFFSNPDHLAVSDDQFQEALRITGQGSDQALETSILAWATDFRDDLRAVRVPTLVIHGDSDNNVPFEASGKRVPQFVPDAQVHVVAGGPHGINVSHAEEFNRVLLGFIASL
ncbi:MAG: alpha/beta hydrolase [Propionibacteriaceae bacterium]|nr:alpha/beta hydrolase [Propionibacteriaceae bacterium]